MKCRRNLQERNNNLKLTPIVIMDVIDPATGLTEEQKDAVRDSWTKISATWKVNGNEFFFRLFRDHPDIRSFFKAFDNLDLEELRKSAKLRAHAINFKHGITSFVDSLDDAETLVALLHKFVANHFRRNINRSDLFQTAFDAFIAFAEETYNVDTFIVNAWKKTVSALVGIIDDQIKSLEQNLDGENM